MNLSQRAKRRTRRRRSRAPLRQEVDLMQLMRRRSRYRPYSVNNRNNRSADSNFLSLRSTNMNRPLFFENDVAHFDNFPNLVNSSRNRINHFNEESFLEPLTLFNAFGTQEIGTNTEIPCFPEFRAQDGNINEVDACDNHEVNLERRESLIFENVSEMQNDPLNSCESLSAKNPNKDAGIFNGENGNSISKLTNEKVKKTLTSSPEPMSSINQSKSEEEGSSDVSGSLISFTEGDNSLRMQYLSARTNIDFSKSLEEFRLKFPPGNLDLTSFQNSSMNSTNLINDITNEDPDSSVAKTKSVTSLKEKPTADIVGNKGVKSINSNSNQSVNWEAKNNEQKSASDEYVQMGNNTNFEPSSSDNTEIKTSPRQESNKDESSSEEIKMRDSPSMVSDIEVIESSSDSRTSQVVTRFDLIPFHSALSNEETGSNEVPVDTEAGGDGHHNDSVIQIEFTLATAIPHDETNAGDEGDDEDDNNNEGEHNNEDT